MSRVTEPSNAMINAPATTDSAMMPLENASRSPRVCSCRGRYRSWARMDPGAGDPVSARVQLPGQVPVLRQDRPEQREPVERGVGRQDQDQRRSGLDEVEEDTV